MILRIVRIFFATILLFAGMQAAGQGISFLTDYLGNVQIFDNGKLKHVEYQPIKSYRTSNIMFAYEDNNGTMKIYHNHFLHKISSFVTSYTVSNQLAAIQLNTQLKVFDKGTTQTLTMSVTDYFVSGDLVVWFDEYDKMLKAYYKSRVYELDDALATGKTEGVLLGKNVVVFNNSQGMTDVFYDGNIDEICYSERLKSVAAGRDVVAFVEEPVNNFQVYYYGDVIELEDFEPTSYKTADQFVAYVDANNYLKVFYNYKTETISFDEPDFYEVDDKVMVFGVQNYFKVWTKGRVYTLESYIPTKYKTNNNVVAYLDQHENLKLFDGEKVVTVSYEKIDDFEIHGNVVKFKYGINSESVYFNGKIYNND